MHEDFIIIYVRINPHITFYRFVASNFSLINIFHLNFHHYFALVNLELQFFSLQSQLEGDSLNSLFRPYIIDLTMINIRSADVSLRRLT